MLFAWTTTWKEAARISTVRPANDEYELAVHNAQVTAVPEQSYYLDQG